MFFERRKQIWADQKAHRHIKKGTGPNPNVPLYSWWHGQHLSYLQARKAIYCPIYARLVVETQKYKELEQLVDEGVNVQILGYDGYDFEAEGKTLQQCFDDPSRAFGHELLVVCLLTNQRVWESDQE